MKEEIQWLHRKFFRPDEIPSLQEMEAAFTGGELDVTERLLCAIAVVTSLGRLKHLRFFLEWAMIENVAVEKVQEVILQCYLFAGYPAAIEGFIVLRDMLEEKGLDLKNTVEGCRTEEWRERGLALCRRVYGSSYDRLRRNMREISPELDEWMIVEGYGKVLSRPGLDPVLRELCTVAALTALNRPRQLFSHIRGALNVGAENEEVREAILLAMSFLGESADCRGLEMLNSC
jgi:4-carboxymuconolactone decarboxylase